MLLHRASHAGEDERQLHTAQQQTGTVGSPVVVGGGEGHPKDEAKDEAFPTFLSSFRIARGFGEASFSKVLASKSGRSGSFG